MIRWERKQTGFTIVELLIVIVVIAILAAITIVAFNGIQARARDSERTAEAKLLQNAIEMYRVDNGTYPLHASGNDNSGYSISVIESLLVPKYINSLPQEPNSTNYYQYVRGTSGNSFGIRMQYEQRTPCHVGGNNQGTNWWSTPAC